MTETSCVTMYQLHVRPWLPHFLAFLFSFRQIIVVVLLHTPFPSHVRLPTCLSPRFLSSSCPPRLRLSPLSPHPGTHRRLSNLFSHTFLTLALPSHSSSSFAKNVTTQVLTVSCVSSPSSGWLFFPLICVFFFFPCVTAEGCRWMRLG